MADYKIGIRITGQLESSFQNAINGAKKGVGGLNLLGKASSGLVKASAGALGAAMTGLVAFGTYSAKVGREFESAMAAAAATAGASAEEYERMEYAAKQMGATTSKTAAESANALEYMALAGWDVETSITALPHVIHLAEASGTDLARTSDLLTDSMSAAGFETERMGHYLDVLTVAQTKSNQTTDQLMEAYIGVGGQLKNLNVPMETSATMLGLLANAGIKGSEGGTALNAVLANMVKRSGDAGKALDDLGISLFDTNGATRDMRDVFGDLNAALAGCTEEQRTTYLAMIGGKQHVDAMNALLTGLNETNEQGVSTWDQLHGAIVDCDQAMTRFYKQKTSTVDYQVKLLESAVEALGVAFYQSDLGVPMASYLQFATNCIGTLQHAFETKGFTGLAQSFGDLIPLALNKVLKDAPQFVEMATVVVESLMNGLDQRADMLGDAAGRLIVKLGEALIRIAPQLVTTGLHLIQAIGQGIIDHLPELGKAAKAAGEFIWTEFKNYFSSLGDTFMDGSKNPMEKLIAALPAIAGGILGFSAIGGIISKVGAFSGVLRGLGKAGQTAQQGLQLKKGAGSSGGGLIGGFVNQLFGKGGGLSITATLKTIGSVGLVVGAITGISSGLGWLGNNVNGFKENLEAGAEIAGAIGNFVGSLVGGLAGGIAGAAGETFMSHLPAMADSLAQFGDSLQPFLDMVDTVDTSKLQGFATSLLEFLAVIAGNNLLTGLNKIFGGGSDGLDQLADQLCSFTSKLGPAFDQLAGLNQTGVDNAPKVFGALSKIGNYEFRSGGIAQLFTGSVDIESIGEQLSAFATSVGPAFDDLAAVNTAGVDNAPKVFGALSKIGNYEFRSGGVAQFFTGEVDIQGIGRQLSAFARGVGTAFDGFASINATGLERAPQIFEMLSSLGGYEFKAGGVAQLFTGSLGFGLAEIGAGLQLFGEKAVPAFNQIATINEAGLQKAPLIFDMLSSMGGMEFKAGGLVQLFTGTAGSGIADLGKGLQAFGETAVPAFNQIATINEAGLEKAPRIFEMLQTLGGMEISAGGALDWLLGTTGGGIADLGKGLQEFSKDVIPVLNSLGEVNPQGLANAPKAFELLQQLGDMNVNAGGALDWLIGSQGGGIADLGKGLQEFCDSVAPALERIAAVDPAVFTRIGPMIDSLNDLGAALSSGDLSAIASSSSLQDIGTKLEGFISSLEPFFQKAAALDLSVFGKVRQLFTSLQGVSDLVASANLSGGSLASFGQELVSFIDSFTLFAERIGAVSGSASGIESFIGSLSQLSATLASVGGEVGAAAAELVSQLDALSAAVSGAGSTLSEFAAASSAVTDGMADMQTAVSNGASEISNTISQLMSNIQSVVTVGMSGLASIAASAMSAFAGAIRSGGQSAVSAARGVVNNVKAAFQNVNLSSAGAQMMNGLLNGINSKRTSVVSAARSVAQAAADAINAAMKIKSPSRVTMESGRYIAEGLAAGMTQRKPVVENAAVQMVTPVIREGRDLGVRAWSTPPQPAAQAPAQTVVPEINVEPVSCTVNVAPAAVPPVNVSTVMPVIRQAEPMSGLADLFDRLAAPQSEQVQQTILYTTAAQSNERSIDPLLRDFLRQRPRRDKTRTAGARPLQETGSRTADRPARQAESADRQIVINYNPVINVEGSGDVQEQVQQALKLDRRTFKKYFEQMMRDNRRTVFR